MPDYLDIIVTGPAPHVRQITLNRPDARNALRSALLGEVAAALAGAMADDAVRAVVLTGGEQVFAAGADIKELAAHDAASIRDDPRAVSWATIRGFEKPLIAAVNGYCLGGGNELAMHADIIVAGDTALFGQPEVNLGIIPGAGGTQRLTHAIGKSAAMRLVLTGAMMGAADALERGLVSEVTPPEMTITRAIEIAVTIAGKPPLAVRAAKKAVLAAYEIPLAEALTFERQLFCQLFATEDMKEGVRAFMEKRQPVFKGK